VNLALGPGPEFDRIRRLLALLGPAAQDIGDDCALVPCGDGFVCLSTDVSVEQVHFRLDWITLEEAGWRATAAALSDLAAEGSRPVGLLCAVSAPATSSEDDLMAVMRGVRDAGAYAAAPVLGGDLSTSPVWGLAMTVVGRSASPVSRSGIRPGDGLWVTGALGGSRAALSAWHRGARPNPAARARYAHPVPRLAAGIWMATHGAHAMIDLSDGLAGDTGHLAAASGVGIEVDVNAVPAAPETAEEAGHLGITPQQFAAEGGEDFELLVALPPAFAGAAAFEAECGLPLTRVGTAFEGSGVRFSRGGTVVSLSSFNHFG